MKIGDAHRSVPALRCSHSSAALWKAEDGRAPVTVDDERLRFNAEASRIPAVIVALHEGAFQTPKSYEGAGESCQPEAGIRAMQEKTLES